MTSDKETSFVEKAILFDKKYSTYSSKRQKVCFLTKTHFFLVSYLPLNITHTTCCKIFSITSRQYVEKDIFFAPTDVFCIGFQPRAGKLSDDGERKRKFCISIDTNTIKFCNHTLKNRVLRCYLFSSDIEFLNVSESSCHVVVGILYCHRLFLQK